MRTRMSKCSRCPCLLVAFWIGFAASVCLAGPAAEPGPVLLRTDSLPLGAPFQPGDGAGVSPTLDLHEHPRAATEPFGTPGTAWLTIGSAVANNFSDATDANLNVAYGWFIAQDVEFDLELGGWILNEGSDTAGGASISMDVRWHLVNKDDWSLFLEAGIGVLGSTSDVPVGGTSFNFLPRLGGGFTRRISDAGTRLQVGVRWHHISNARILGDTQNAERNAPLVFVGIMIPF